MKTKLIILCFAATVFSACSSYSYYSVSNKPLDPQKYKTFAWIPEGKSTSIYNNDIATDKIVESGTIQMNARGFTIASETPDLLLRYTRETSE